MSDDKELVLTCVIDATPEKVYRCWTTPELVKKWFAPRPWSTSVADMDVRPGGATNIVMRSPEGQEFANPGIFLDVEPNRRLVFTDAFRAGWIPSGEPFMAAEIRFEPTADGKTLYTATARHWSTEARDRHEKMGFHQGWGICAKQLEEVARTL